MPKVRVHISAEGEQPAATVKRQLGRQNYGLYCNGCDEFFALAVSDPLKATDLEIVSDGEPMFECPFCHLRERRQPSEIAQVMLTERLKRRPAKVPGLH